MSGIVTEYWPALIQLTEKIAVELVYTGAGKDDGLLPINSLLSEMEGVAENVPLPAPIPQALTKARSLIDSAFESGVFDAGQLGQLGEWIQWMQAALPAGQRETALPALPTFATSAPPAPSFPLPGQPKSIEPSGDGHLPAEEALVMNIDSDGDLLREFLNESQEHLQNIEAGVLTLEENPSDADTLNSIFRAFHTFKGGSGFLNLIPMKNLAHELESLLDLARNQKLTVDLDVINVILEGGDTLKQYIAEMSAQLAGRAPVGPIIVPSQALLARVRVFLGQRKPASQTGAAAPVAQPVPMPAAVPPKSPLPSPSPTAAAPDPAHPVESPTGKPAAATKTKDNAGFVKVDTSKLDSLVDLVGEMVIAQSLIAQDKDILSLESQQLARNLAHLRRITNDLQRTAMSMRMVPIRATFQKMHRLVRDTSAKIGKQAELLVDGEDTELDRTIVEEISDPLIHMVRNSVDHGIETPEARIAAGKSPTGHVHLRAFHRGGNIVIEIKDDGAGLNKDRLLAKAREKGIVREGEELSEKEIFNLIFAPGFSTAAVITDISGRGVGMDVVRKNIDKLRGKIDIQSTLGQGSTFTISLPLTLAIIDGLIVSVGAERYILPTLSVRESFRPTTEMLSTLHERGEMVNVRGRLSPLLRLYDYFDVTAESTQPSQGIVVVVEADGADRCILVDRLLGKQEVVIKSLGETFKANPAIAGGAILGDGRVGLILDINALVHLRPAGLVSA